MQPSSIISQPVHGLWDASHAFSTCAVLSMDMLLLCQFPTAGSPNLHSPLFMKQDWSSCLRQEGRSARWHR